MPAVNSIIVEKGEILAPANKHNCCQFLHRSPQKLESYVILKHLYHHKDITERFQRWIKFLEDKFELPIPYRLTPLKVKGWGTHADAKNIYETYKDKYYLTPLDKTPYTGVKKRVEESDVYISPEHEIFVVAYFPGNILAPKKGRGGGDPLMNNPNIPYFEVPAAVLDLPFDLAPEHNNFKYITWYMVRYFLNYLARATFLMDNEENLEKLMKKYNIGWYNIFFAMQKVLQESGFSINTRINITRSAIERAFEASATVYFDFNYKERELNIQSALGQSYKHNIYSNYANIKDQELSWDGTGGIYSKKSNALLSKTISDYLTLIFDSNV